MKSELENVSIWSTMHIAFENSSYLQLQIKGVLCPILYSKYYAFCMNNKFILLYFQFFCKNSKEHKSHQQHCCSNSSSGVIAHNPGCDFEGLSEKYWGEILERTLSSSSLHALQRAYSHPRMERCNGLQEMKVFDTAVPDL